MQKGIRLVILPHFDCQVTYLHLFLELKTKLNEIKTTFYFSAQENSMPDILNSTQKYYKVKEKLFDTARYHIQIFNTIFQ